MTFKDELIAALNRACAESRSNTPDFILAHYLIGCLNAFDVAVNERTAWYDPKIRAGAAQETEVAPIPCNLPFERTPHHAADPGFGPVPPEPKVVELRPEPQCPHERTERAEGIETCLDCEATRKYGWHLVSPTANRGGSL